MKIIVLDKRENFLTDIQTRLMLDERDIELVGQSTSASNVTGLVQDNHPDYLVIADNILNEQEDWIFPNCVTIGYMTKKSDKNPFTERGIAAYGYVVGSEHLLNSLSLAIPEKEPVVPAQPKVETTNFSESVPAYTQPPISVQPTPTPMPPVQPSPVQPIPDPVPVPVPAPISTPICEQEQSTQEHHPASSAPQPEQTGVYQTSVKEQLRQAAAYRNTAAANSMLKEELERIKKETTVVTVYAAKGGVGKTTISTELATELACTVVGRGPLRTCIIDCNIDFGDVLTTLDYDPAGPNLSFWAGEIRERLDRGEKPEEIVYTKDEIEKRLQMSSKTGLFALIAPITHEDSMDIDSTEMEIIFDNIIQNGDFDFVVCDTGNNTRDSSVLALERASVVLLVGTQDVSTASCNSAFLSTMKKINFDTDKIRLIVNGILPFKVTQVSVEELEAMFPYKCVARIKRAPEVIKANNCSEPIVLTDEEHQFAKEIKKVAAYLTGQETLGSTKKKGLFKKLFKK